MTQAAAVIAIPPGFRANSKGHLVPESQIRQVEILIDDYVNELYIKWVALHEAMVEFQAQTFADVHALLGTVNEEYGVKKGGEKGNVQLLSFDGSKKFLIAVNDLIEAGPEIQAARELILECTQKWKEGARQELVTVVNELLATDGKGGISISKALQLRRYKIDDEEWRVAMKALNDALRVVGSKQYMRLYVRNAAGGYVQIPLDMAAL